MKFGKLANIEGVNFDLPVDPPKNEAILSPANERKKLNFYIGCTGWSMKEWVGKVYPTGTKAKDYLKYYSQQFNTIELNTTHYRIPNESTIQKWYSESAPDFKFCPKVLQQISHSRNLGASLDQLLNFCETIQDLNEKLGCSFIQLPPYFGKDRLAILEAFLKNWPNHLALAVEVRQESWFKTKEDTSLLIDLLKKYQVATVITDVAGRRDVLHMHLSTPSTMIRFVGNGLHSTDYQRIDSWVNRINQWFKLGLEEVYFFTHEPDNILAPELAQYLFGKLQSYEHIAVRGPKFLEEKEEGQQMSLF